MKRIGFLLVFGLFSLCSLQANVYNQFGSKTSCVAYQTTKGIFYVSNVDVVGVNCSITIKKVNNNIQVIIPVDKFDSGNSKRDAEVAAILGNTPLRFEAQIPENTKQESIPTTMIGKLFVNGKENLITLNLSQNSSLIQFKVITKFSTLGVKVNPVGPGGLIAEPQDDLILYGQIPKNTIFEKK